ncbi:hypothetical protein AC579_7280 [Pseudocercospora musae]|uniref:Endoplasmic reticulum junction formation protein lunapark n=1 Tax=Pseudocercospora musae TaxID=113226 RepID=A0A139GVR6_9PEZI|nr:hypothetical protein AC579_7280 [Pseudocercospora musae]
MVSFWPFKGDSNDAASFEKILSQLSTKINRATAQNERFQQRRRRYKVLWTLYSVFAYILVAAILTLVTGYEKWGALEYSLVAGSPVVIFGIRAALDAYYNWRIANSQNHINELQKERDKAIERLKHATKYDSTQKLLEKYGASPPEKRQPSPRPNAKRQSIAGPGSKPSTPMQGRTGFAPPPTANIPSRQPPPPGPQTPQVEPGSVSRLPTGLSPASPTSPISPQLGAPGEEFAPNAFTRPPTWQQPSRYATDGPKWYDRILDVVLGEDETSAKNRIALICQNCRLVNGQAPPGALSLEDIGRWRCSQCHAMNGVESEEKKILKQISHAAPGPESPESPEEANAPPQPVADEEDEDDAAEDEEDGCEEVDTTPAASTRSKARQRKKV